MTDVFISYKREERADCERIASKLRALQLDVWFDARLTAGESFSAEIEREVRRAKSVLVLWSPASVQSRWVRNEADIGRERGVLVAVQLKPCTMPIDFRDIHFDQLHNPNFGDDDPAWLKILSRVEVLCRRPGLAEYSRAVAVAGAPLRSWADRFPTDPLAESARELADSLIGKPKSKRSRRGAVLAATAMTAALLAGVGGYVFAKREAASSAAQLLPAARAAEFVGAWNEVGLGNCEQDALNISLTPDGLALSVAGQSSTREIEGVSGDWLTMAGGGQFRREGNRLFSRSNEHSSASEYVRCS